MHTAFSVMMPFTITQPNIIILLSALGVSVLERDLYDNICINDSIQLTLVLLLVSMPFIYMTTISG